MLRVFFSPRLRIDAHTHTKIEVVYMYIYVPRSAVDSNGAPRVSLGSNERNDDETNANRWFDG